MGRIKKILNLKNLNTERLNINNTERNNLIATTEEEDHDDPNEHKTDYPDLVY